MKDIYENNKFTIWIGIITIIVLIVGLFIYFNMDTMENNTEILFKDEYDLVLFGSDVEISQDGIYQEPGFYAILNNEIVTQDVVIDNPVDVSKAGNYEISYKYRNITKIRNVKVLENSNSKKDEKIDDNKDYNIQFKLNGNSVISLKINDKYQELGASAIDSNGNDISKDIKITNNLNINQVGSYKIIYSINKNGVSKTLERIVNVVANTTLKATISNNDKYTNKDVLVTIEAIGNDYSYMKMPDNTVSRSNVKEYVIKENGTYIFEAYDNDNSVKIEKVTINNIDKIKPSGTCTALIENNKTVMNVVANDNIGIDHYQYNGKIDSNSNTYTYNGSLNNSNVVIYDKAGNYTNVTCNIIKKNEPVNEIQQISDDGNLEIHFMVSGHDDDAILIRNNKYTIMIDGGRYEDKKNVIPYLQDLGVKKIDLLIGSHVHWNHIQSQAAIIENFEVSKAIYSIDIFNCKKNKTCDSNDIKYVLDSLKKNNINTEMKVPGDYLEFGDIKIYFLGPIYPNKVHNSNSFVFILKYRNTSYMFTGDAPTKLMDTSKFEQTASKWNLSLDIDVLKWPHHGYNNLTDTFFKATTPKYIYIPSSGCDTKYPSSTDKKLIQKYGSKTYSRCDKNVVFISDGNNIDIKTKQKAKDYAR